MYVHCGMLWTAQSVWHNSICVSVVDDIAGDDATAGGEVKELPHKWTNITIHITKISICCVHG